MPAGMLFEEHQVPAGAVESEQRLRVEGAMVPERGFAETEVEADHWDRPVR